MKDDEIRSNGMSALEEISHSGLSIDEYVNKKFNTERKFLTYPFKNLTALMDSDNLKKYLKNFISAAGTAYITNHSLDEE